MKSPLPIIILAAVAGLSIGALLSEKRKTSIYSEQIDRLQQRVEIRDEMLKRKLSERFTSVPTSPVWWMNYGETNVFWGEIVNMTLSNGTRCQFNIVAEKPRD